MSATEMEEEGVEPLPTPYDILNRHTWIDRGACKGADTSLWFSEERAEQAEAIAVCRRCPVRAICAEYAVLNGEEYGIWGGLTDTQLRRIRFDRGLIQVMRRRPPPLVPKRQDATEKKPHQRRRLADLPDEPPPHLPKLVSRDQLARAWQISPSGITYGMRAGYLPWPIANEGRTELFDRDAMWAARREMLGATRRPNEQKAS